MKTCTQCNISKNLKDFWKDQSSKDGVKSYCKTCGKNYNGKLITKEDGKKYYQNRKERYKKDPEYHKKILENRRQYTIDNPEKIMWGQAKIRATKKGLDFNIELADIVIPSYCPILGIKINYGHGRTKGRDAASLDRIDITKGYVKGNVKVISDMANTMKNNATFDQLRKFAENIILYIDDDIVHAEGKPSE